MGQKNGFWRDKTIRKEVGYYRKEHFLCRIISHTTQEISMDLKVLLNEKTSYASV